MARRDWLLGLCVVLVVGCGSGDGPPKTSVTFTTTISNKVNNNLDLLFMVENASSTTPLQLKLQAQIPAFLQALEMLPGGLPNIHIAVVSSDMGAPGDSTSSIGCTFQGDQAQFQAAPRTTCAATTLSAGSTFISDVDNQTNFTDPIDKVLQCIIVLGSSGCGFTQPLASIVRALGTDGMTPALDSGFLRPDAYLGIVLVTNQDDCSAPANTTIFSLNGGAQSISNPDGPIAKYRCIGGPRGGHLCQDPATGAMVVPPLNPPVDATGNPPILNLENCRDNDTGSSALTPVTTFVNQIKSLKADPDNQIVVAAITSPAAPYAVQWLPPANPPQGTTGQVWPAVMDSCGAAGASTLNPMSSQTTTDGTTGNPAVRITQFVQAFAKNAVSSVCDASYLPALTAIASKLGGLMRPGCLATGPILPDPHGQPMCSVINHVADSTGAFADVPVANCNENGGSAPCWTLDTDPSCAAGSFLFHLVPDAASTNAPSLSSTIECSLCRPGVTPGC